MEIIQKNKNILLNREEIVVLLTENSTPSKESLKEKIASHFKTSNENVVIDRVNSNFGTKNFIVHSKIYDDKKSKDKFEVISKKQRDASKKAAEEADKKAQVTENSEGGSQEG
ncbi:MAG TPA: hypothetical protein VI815_04075 [Candidatus Nanoarchaeia archaeon]|nr:hypothetical protein [Candidatus Nanoarchaeia archaeon]